MKQTYEGKVRLSPSSAAAIAAALGSVATCGATVLAGTLASGSAAAMLAAGSLTSLAAAGVTLTVTRRAMRTEYAALSDRLVQLVTPEPARAVLRPSQEADELLAALDRCREVLAERQGVARVHAAVARLLGNAIRRLADGDFAARITVELPVPYRSFRDDFNGVMEALETTVGGLADTGAGISERAQEIASAAETLSRRAARLAERLDSDIRTIDAGASADPAAMLDIARHTLGGVTIATRRNSDAAARFSELGSGLAREARRLYMLAGVEPPRAGGSSEPDMPAVSRAAS